MIAELIDLAIKGGLAAFAVYYLQRQLEAERRLSALEAKTTATLDAVGRELARLSDAIDSIRGRRR